MSKLTVDPAPVHSQWTFTQGLILGQASFMLLILVFIRYVVFSPADKRDGEDWRKRRDERVKVSYRIHVNSASQRSLKSVFLVEVADPSVAVWGGYAGRPSTRT